MRCGVGEALTHEMRTVQAQNTRLAHMANWLSGERDTMCAEIVELKSENARLSSELNALHAAAQAAEKERRARTDSLLGLAATGGAALARAARGAASWAERGRDAARREAEEAAASRQRCEEAAESARQALARAEADRTRAEEQARVAAERERAAAEAAVAAARVEERRLAAAKAAAERLALMAQLEAERAEGERAAAERAAVERAERDKLAAERLAAQAAAAQAAEAAAAAQAQRDLIAAQKAAAERAAAEDLERARRAADEAAAANEEGAWVAFSDAWKAAPANRRGRLSLTVHRARGLKKADYSLLGGSSDPYVVVQMNDSPPVRTATKTNSTTPVWEDKFDLGECSVRPQHLRQPLSPGPSPGRASWCAAHCLLFAQAPYQ